MLYASVWAAEFFICHMGLECYPADWLDIVVYEWRDGTQTQKVLAQLAARGGEVLGMVAVS